MDSNDQINSEELNSKQEDTNPSNESKATHTEQLTSATTSDIPEFGWSGYAERINGRFAMIGFIAILLIEALSQDSFLHWTGLG